MATLFIGYDRGDVRATGASSTTSKEIEMAVDDAANITPRELKVGLDRIYQDFLETNGFTE